MPGSILNADINFPHFTGAETTDEKFNIVTDYLYMLYEQLRYSMSNLSVENFNETGLKMITDPIKALIKDEDGKIAELGLTVKGLSTRVQDAEGNITTLGLSVSGLSTQVQNVEGDVSELGLSVSGLTTRVQDAEGNISTISQTVSGLTTRVQSAEGNISTISQTVSGLTSTVSTIGGSVNVIQQTLNGVVFYDSETGQTVIDGSHITTGTINANVINMNGLLQVMNGQTQGGYLGYGYGNNGQSNTSGVVLASARKQSYGTSDHYIIVTNSGVRMQSGNNALYCIGTGVHKVVNGVDTEIGEAVFG